MFCDLLILSALSSYRLDAWHDFKFLVSRTQWRRGHILDASLCHKEKDSSLESLETSPFSDNSMETYQERQLSPSVKNTRIEQEQGMSVWKRCGACLMAHNRSTDASSLWGFLSEFLHVKRNALTSSSTTSVNFAKRWGAVCGCALEAILCTCKRVCLWYREIRSMWFKKNYPYPHMFAGTSCVHVPTHIMWIQSNLSKHVDVSSHQALNEHQTFLPA